MKRIVKIAACVLVAAVLALGALVAASENSYSSEEDPLISLSYVNKVLLPQVKEMILDTLAGVEIGDIIVTAPPVTTEEPEETTEEPVETTTAPEETVAPEPEETFPSGTVNTGSKYVVVNLKEGEVLYASVNACEVIVRSGKATVTSPFTVKWEEQGVSDTTDGKELYNDDTVPTNHTIIIPRDDGRGIVVGEGGAWLMVRGDFIVKGVEPAAETTAETAAETTEATE